MAFFIAIGLTGCLDPVLEERTYFVELIGEHLENNPDEFSTLVELLEKAESMSFLKAYGEYTLLAPTNSAFERFFAASDEYSSLADMDMATLQAFVKYHVISLPIPSTEFVDGRMHTPNMFGHYITTGVQLVDNRAVLTFNRHAHVLQRDIVVANGIIHSINEVIVPETTPAAIVLEQNPRFSIFNEALARTGWFDSLKVATSLFTVFAIPDEVYRSEGFDTFQELWTDIDPDQGTLTDKANPMNRYVAYHILGSRKYVSDLMLDRVGLTMVDNEVVTVRTVGATVLVNDDIFAGVHEPGFEINRAESDRTVLNGVIHVMKADFRIKQRFPFAVYWDVAEQLEIMRMPGVFRRSGPAVLLEQGDLANITWGGGTILYEGSGGGAANPWVVHGDLFNIMLRPEVVPWMEFVTPVLAAGDYKVWICFRGSSAERHPAFFVHFNDIPLPNIIRTSPYNPRNRPETPGYSERELENRGMKFYQWNPDDISFTREDANDPAIRRNILESNYIADGRVFARLAGTITVPTTGPHRIRFVAISGTKELWIDMIHFIPVGEDQLWPRVNTRTGELVTREEIHAAFAATQATGGQ